MLKYILVYHKCLSVYSAVTIFTILPFFQNQLWNNNWYRKPKDFQFTFNIIFFSTGEEVLNSESYVLLVQWTILRRPTLYSMWLQHSSVWLLVYIFDIEEN